MALNSLYCADVPLTNYSLTHSLRYCFTAHFFNLSIYCRLYEDVQDPVSFTVTTGLLGRLGLGLRVRVSIRIIFTFFGIYYKLIPLL